MEHILQFGISIDDEMIKKRVEAAALEQLTNKFTSDIKDIIFEKNCYSNRHTTELTGWVEDRFFEFLTQHKSEIIDIAAEKLADKLSRSKAAKDLLKERSIQHDLS